MNKRILLSGAVFGLLAVVFGAFGAHGLKGLLAADTLNSFETGVKYQMYHSLVLLFLGSFDRISQDKKRLLYYLFLIGILLFSGSIYFLTIDELLGVDLRIIAFLTPIGGTLLIIAWILLGIRFFKLKNDN
ncbi:DUF423 domain-containing protein [Sungkyunkwania multivorans]|uniref:DUF423 domain-containing protein n=1 Tax=Sungkyunkwania multivorans TaxID=1173618 RepID=A0ABW3CWT1_9FLAO